MCGVMRAAVELEAVAAAAEAACRMSDSSDLAAPRNVASSTVAGACTIHGDGLTNACAGKAATFTIEARNESGDVQTTGGDGFSVSIRLTGQGTRCRARLTDLGDGTYTCHFKPIGRGRCTISVALQGQQLPGSPFTCHVRAPVPSAAQCIVEGAALSQVTAGKPASFQISFRDDGGQLAPSGELDVLVQQVRDMYHWDREKGRAGGGEGDGEGEGEGEGGVRVRVRVRVRVIG